MCIRDSPIAHHIAVSHAVPDRVGIPIRKIVINVAFTQFFGKRRKIVLCAVDHARDFRACHIVFQPERAVAISVDNAIFQRGAYDFGKMLL